MGVKTARTKQARKEMRRTHKAVEKCPYCSKKQYDLDAHIQSAHGHICERCGQRFASEGHWRQHMRDKHGLDGSEAVKDDCRKKIERWVKNANRGGKAARKAAAAAAAAGVTGPLAANDSAMDDTELGPVAPGAAAGGVRHCCELCGAEALLPVNLTESGLSFTCAHVGRRCGSSGAPQASPAAAPVPPPTGLGVFAGVRLAAVPPAPPAQLPAFSARMPPASAAGLFAGVGFAAAPPAPPAQLPSIFSAQTPIASAVAAVALLAAGVPVPDLDSDEDL